MEATSGRKRIGWWPEALVGRLSILSPGVVASAAAKGLQPLFLDKGKPVVRPGRKAKGQQEMAGSLAAERKGDAPGEERGIVTFDNRELAGAVQADAQMDRWRASKGSQTSCTCVPISASFGNGGGRIM